MNNETPAGCAVTKPTSSFPDAPISIAPGRANHGEPPAIRPQIRTPDPAAAPSRRQIRNDLAGLRYCVQPRHRAYLEGRRLIERHERIEFLYCLTERGARVLNRIEKEEA